MSDAKDERKLRRPDLCSWCKWGNPDANNCIEPANDDRSYNQTKCIDFEIDPTVTTSEIAWWPIAWAASEIDRLSVQAATHSLTTPTVEGQK